MARTREIVNERPREVATIAIAVAGRRRWRLAASSRGKRRATARRPRLLATALAVAEAPVVTPPPPAPGSAPPVQPPGSFRTERERLEAAVPVLQRAADAYPDSDAGITARYRLAASLAELGRFAEAEQRYQEVDPEDRREEHLPLHRAPRRRRSAARAGQGRRGGRPRSGISRPTPTRPCRWTAS